MTTPPETPSTPRGDELLHLDALDNGYQEVAEYIAYGLFRSCVEAYLKHATRPAQAALSEEEFAEIMNKAFQHADEIGISRGHLSVRRMDIIKYAYRALTAAQNRGGR